MANIKKMAASVAAFICIGGIGLTAYADAGKFNFSLIGNDETAYYDTSGRVHKSDMWSKNAVVEIHGGNLSSSNKAELAVIDSSNFYTSNPLTDYKTVSGNYTYTLTYDEKYADNRPSSWNVYLLARTLGDDVNFYGEWEP